MKIIFNVNSSFLNGFFYVFGLVDNPVRSKAIDVYNSKASDQIKKSIFEVNHSLKHSFEEYKEKMLIER
jgi:hypothetical protein